MRGNHDENAAHIETFNRMPASGQGQWLSDKQILARHLVLIDSLHLTKFFHHAIDHSSTVGARSDLRSKIRNNNV
ncbi:hypothetical protein G6O67_008429 [Ophiocordyceps sinensis]|uniref:Uncharacterized protein n=1 Tax=Ophiocordyceps sinensis TaxID=72228 RepID=A0A8H4LRA3_9HYPO|nr:hypothetical protein G6O67_008429 [Ophiocordyceps sinensis]